MGKIWCVLGPRREHKCAQKCLTLKASLIRCFVLISFFVGGDPWRIFLIGKFPLYRFTGIWGDLGMGAVLMGR